MWSCEPVCAILPIRDVGSATDGCYPDAGPGRAVKRRPHLLDLPEEGLCSRPASATLGEEASERAHRFARGQWLVARLVHDQLGRGASAFSESWVRRLSGSDPRHLDLKQTGFTQAHARAKPQVIVSDNGIKFTSNVVLGWANWNGLQRIRQADAERLHRIFQRSDARRSSSPRLFIDLDQAHRSGATGSPTTTRGVFGNDVKSVRRDQPRIYPASLSWHGSRR
jgi:hypothetical protein